MKKPTPAEQAELDRLLEEHAGEGVSHDPDDYAFWLPESQSKSPVLRAISEFDYSCDKAPLLKLLRSQDRDLTYPDRVWLADLLERHDLVKRKGRPPIPAYDRSPEAVKLEWAELDYRQNLETMSRAKAIEAAAKYADVDVETFIRHLEGRHGPTGRASSARWCPPRSETCPEGCKVYAGSLLIPAAVGAYSENGPVGATINPRRVRLIARRG